jgi:FkbM family methyltransferase
VKARDFRNWLAAAVRAAQAVEELSLVRRLFDTRGVMIDVGAHTGQSFAAFAVDGWQIYAFEPDPRNHGEIQARWSGAANVRIEAKAVADRDRAEVAFQLSSNTYLSSLSAFDSSHSESIRVPQVALRSYCAERKLTAVDLLKVDAEGYDLLVLRGFPWDQLKPRCVVCEFEDRKGGGQTGSFAQMADLLRAQGYRIIVSEWHPIVSYQGPFRWRRFFTYPGQQPGPEGNGNIVAVQTAADFRRLKRLCVRKTFAHRVCTGLRRTYAWARGRAFAKLQSSS